MKRTIFVLGLVFTLVSCGKPADTLIITRANGDEVARYEITVADDPKERATGLQGMKSLGTDEGMFFVFNGEGKLSFWNKDVLFPIDIIFADHEGIVTTIFEQVPPCDGPDESCPLYESEEDAQYVLELNAGQVKERDIKERDRLLTKYIVR